MGEGIDKEMAIDLSSITPMSFSAAKSKVLGRGDAAVWFPDGDMAAEVHENLGTYPDPIDAIELAELFSQAPTMAARIRALEAERDEAIRQCDALKVQLQKMLADK